MSDLEHSDPLLDKTCTQMISAITDAEHSV